MGKLKKAVANGSGHGPWRENTYRLLGDDGELPWLNSLLGELPGRVPLQNWPQVEQKRVRTRDLETIQMEQEKGSANRLLQTNERDSRHIR